MTSPESSGGRKMAREVSSAYLFRGGLSAEEITKARERYERSATRYAERIRGWAEGWTVEIQSDGRDSQVPIEIKAAVLRNIREVPEGERTALIEASLQQSALSDVKISSKLVLSAAAAILLARPTDQDHLTRDLIEWTRENLQRGSASDRAIATLTFGYLPEAVRADLILGAIKNAPTGILFSGINDKAVKSIGLAPVSERAALVRAALEKYPNHIAGYQMITSVPEELRGDLPERLVAWIRDWLSQQLIAQSVDYSAAVGALINDAPREAQEKLRELFLQKVLLPIFDMSRSGRKEFARLVGVAPQRARADLYRRLVQDIKGDIDQGFKDSFFVAHHLPQAQREEILAYAHGKRMAFGDPLATPLYAAVGDAAGYTRANFDKKGSRTTLLGDAPLLGGGRAERQGAVIVRHITTSAFDAWRRAYEAEDFWKQQGFDYVPIEPIVSWIAMRGKDEVRVTTGVLGPSLEHWLENSGWKHAEMLLAQTRRIRKALGDLHVKHGHLHDRNFCLVFPRRADGTPDTDQVPRIFAIDFDAAQLL